jgi:myosin heavy subunit
MLDNIDYSDPAVLEAFKEMIGELRFSVLEDIIKRNKVLRDEFTNPGYHFVPKNKDRAVKIIFNDCKDDCEVDRRKRTILFEKWLGKNPEYQRILETYFNSAEYLMWDKDGNKKKSDELTRMEQAAFDELTAVLPENHVSYFMYFSHIEFNEELTAKWRDLADQENSEKIKLLRKIVFNKNDEIHNLKSSVTEERNKIREKVEKEQEELKEQVKSFNDKIKKFEEELGHKNKRIEELKNQLDEMRPQSLEIENLKRQNRLLSLKEKELEKLKNEGLAEFIETKKDEINAKLNQINLALEQKKNELEEISIKISEEKENKETLEEINALKRRELFEYVDKGEKWKKVLFPGLKGDSQEEKVPGLKFVKMTGERNIIGDYSEFKRLMEITDFSDDDIDRIRPILNQFSHRSIFRVKNMDEMKQIEEFFQVLGHQNGKFTLNTDISWLTPEYLWKTKGYLDGCDTPITFPDAAALA